MTRMSSNGTRKSRSSSLKWPINCAISLFTLLNFTSEDQPQCPDEDTLVSVYFALVCFDDLRPKSSREFFYDYQQDASQYLKRFPATCSRFSVQRRQSQLTDPIHVEFFKEIMAKFYSGIEDKEKDVCYGVKLGNWHFSIKFPKIPGVLKGHQREDDGSKTSWDFQGFIGKRYLNEPVDKILKKKAESMVDVFHGGRYRGLKVEDAIPLDTLSANSDHIYAEIDTPSTPPTIPRRADTPIFNEAPDYPPYSSRQVRMKRSRSERRALNKDESILLPLY